MTTRDLPSHGAVHVPLERFSFTLRLIRRAAEIIPLRELVRRHSAGLRTSGLVSVTFDDAYAALLTAVFEVIRHDQVPVTVFVVGEAARAGLRYWWDRIEEAAARVSPERWRAFEDAVRIPPEYRNGQPVELGALRPLRQWILSAHQGRWPSALEPTLAALERDAGSSTAHRSMTFEELDRLAASSLVDIGIHTQSHPVLPLLADREVRQEIASCYAQVRERWSKAIPVVAHPFGLLDRRTLRIARQAGMNASLALGNTTLGSPRSPAGAVPRFVATAGQNGLRLALGVLGVLEPLRAWRGGVSEYPALPSPTT